MYSTYSSLLPLILPELRNCPEPLMLQALARAGRELCTRTLIWQKELGPYSLVAGQANYTLVVGETVPDGDQQPVIRWIDWVKISGVEISTFQYDLVHVTNVPTLHFKDDYVPGSAVTDGLEVNVVLVPSNDSGYLSGFIIDTYSDTLAAGALYHLLGMPDKPWTSTERSVFFYHEFAAGVIAATEESFIGRKTGSLSINLNARAWL
jgi:hypothetical protein